MEVNDFLSVSRARKAQRLPPHRGSNLRHGLGAEKVSAMRDEASIRADVGQSGNDPRSVGGGEDLVRVHVLHAHHVQFQEILTTDRASQRAGQERLYLGVLLFRKEEGKEALFSLPRITF